MKLSYEWLSEYIDLSHISPEELGEKMSRTGIEVDSVEVLGEQLQRIVVGRTVSVSDHPDSDHLHVVMVDVGEEEPIQIVCGAPNVSENQKVVVALHGARVAGGHKIKKGKIRGEVSNGMICSLQELGIPSQLVPKASENGIYVIEDPSVKVGEDAIRLLGLDSAIIELDLTANRADALSVRGAVCEIAAIYGLQHKMEKDVFEVAETSSIPEWIEVHADHKDDVQAYHMLVIENVTIKPSPVWMQRRLIASGIRPINNVVDVTNYILMEYGQPLHALDYDRLEHKQIAVRRAKEGEKLVTLDGVERSLTDEIIITDGVNPIALAGVMGGLDTEITAVTTTVALEAALFSPAAVRKASQTHHLRSESSIRFEKGVNRSTVLQAGRKAAEWIAELGGGRVVDAIASVQNVPVVEPIVSIRYERINHVLGTSLTKEEVHGIFNQLGFSAREADEVFYVTIPTRRWDISIEADLIEEIGRIYGYDRIPATLPTTSSTRGGLTEKQRFIRWTRQTLQALGLSQAYSYALTTPEKAVWFTSNPLESVRLDMPMSEERSTLRQSLLPSLLEAVQYNVARSQQTVRLFEVGRVFAQESTQQFVEKEVIGACITGNEKTEAWNAPLEKVDFFSMKGIVEAYLKEMNLDRRVRFEALQDVAELHPGQSATIYLDEKVIGLVGRVHPILEKENGLKPTFVFELELLPLFEAQQQARTIQSVPKFPGTSRDLAVLVPQLCPHAQLVELILQHGGALLKDVRLFDVYEGDRIPTGYKSLAYSLQFLNREATLTEEEVSQAMNRIIEALQTVENLEIR